ncbi:FkbM family methyltransferase [Sphingomonas trueperi]|uniref:FkbM family methyltransferase n=1 Tax=Sphingomonas trueperi TaxID=53317 RepID=UPI003393F3C2
MTKQDFSAMLDSAVAAPAANQQLASDLLSGQDRPCYVIGRNAESLGLIGRLRLDGIVDDFAPAGSVWNGLAAVGMAQLPPDAAVINCSTSISPVAVEQRLADAGVRSVLSIQELAHASGGAIADADVVREQRADWRRFAPEWADIFDTLADEASRRTLADVLRYRLTANAAFMRGYAVRTQEQYFEPFLDLRSEVFVDAGGFDGDTTEEFCRRCPDYRQVHLFEPSERNLRAAKARLAGHRDIAFHAKALSDAPGQIAFDSEAGSASAVTSGGRELVEMTTVDLAIPDPVSFIKMDLEGWEIKALAGCERHIRQDRPKLAIAVYHRASDFRDIWRYVRSLHADYQVYLRHYTQGWSETVMFFL